ncbi:mitochondrial small ribosomal subunit Rsm22, partial [Helicosporidium sp. ATCC 50920]
DLVVAAYVLGELPDDAARARLVRDLWRRTQDVLVLVEPGTPAGFRAVAAARAQILGLEGAGGARRREGRGSYGEAHVLAPCPHDGECPLLGRKSWCHFSQRFERSFLQRRAKAKGNLAAVRGYQDERFSYVAIARGSRPEPLHAGVIVSPPSSSDDEAAEGEDYEDEALDADEDDELMARLAQPEVFATLNPEAQAALRAYLARTEASDDESARSGGDLGRDASTLEMVPHEEDGDDEAAEGDSELPPASGAAELPLRAAQNWSRVLRPPVRRTRHVILDLCSADPSAPDGSRGRLWRQIVSRRKTLSVLDDKTAYRMARKLRWGDLWPAYYEAALKGFEPGERRMEKELAELEEEEYDWRLGDPDAEDEELQFAFGGYERRGQDVEDEDEESKA